MPEKPPAPVSPVIWVDGYSMFDEGAWLLRDSKLLKSWACGHARRPDAGRHPGHRCPPCSADRKRQRKFIAGHIALIVIQLVLGFVMVGGGRP